MRWSSQIGCVSLIPCSQTAFMLLKRWDVLDSTVWSPTHHPSPLTGHLPQRLITLAFPASNAPPQQILVFFAEGRLKRKWLTEAAQHQGTPLHPFQSLIWGVSVFCDGAGKAEEPDHTAGCVAHPRGSLIKINGLLNKWWGIISMLYELQRVWDL